MALSDTHIHIASAQFSRDLPEWANETTLADLRDIARTHMLYATGTEPKEARSAAASLDRKEEKRSEKIVKGIKLLHKDFTINKLVSAFVRGGASFEKILKDAVVDMAQGILKWIPGGELLGALGIGIAALIKSISNAHSMFLEVYDAGVSLNGSFVGLIRGAANAHMSVTDFASALSQHSVSIQNLITEVGHGGAAFSDLSFKVRRSLYQYDQLGLSIADINEYMGGYLDTQRMMGIRDQLSSLQRATATKEYLVNLTQLSHMTGKHRKELASQMQARMQDTQWVTYLQSLPADIRDGMQKAVGTFSAQSDLLGTMFQEIARYGAPVSENTIKLSSVLGDAGIDLRSFSDRIKAGGKVSAKELQNETLRIAERVRQFQGQQGHWLSINQGYEEVNSALIEMGAVIDDRNTGFSSSLDGLLASWDQLKADVMAPFTKIFAGFLERMNKEGGLFEKIANGFTNTMKKIADVLEKDILPAVEVYILDNIELLGDKLVEFIDWIAHFFDPEKETTFWEDAKGWMKTGVDGLVEILGEVLKDLMIDLAKLIWEWTSPVSLGMKAGEAIGEYLGLTGEEEAMAEGGGGGGGHFRGGIATVASTFGEKGPEAAIPLDTGQRIPIAEIKGGMNQKELSEINMTLRDILNRLETQNSTTADVATNIRRLESVTKSNNRTVF